MIAMIKCKYDVRYNAPRGTCMAALNVEKAKTLDARGLFCPEPVFRTKVEVETLKAGQCLQVLADDPAAEEDITRWAKRTGQELVSFRRDGNDLVFLIRRVK